MFRKPCSIETQKSHNVIVKNKIKIKIINTKANVNVGAYLSKKKKRKKDGLYNTNHKLPSEKWIVKRSRFQAS